jgi:Na+/pantothenate symporter
MNHPEAQPGGLIDGLKSLLGPDWHNKLNLLGYNGTVDPERILPAVILFNLPVGVRGLLIVALLAAAMSTFNAITRECLTRDVATLRAMRGKYNREGIITEEKSFDCKEHGLEGLEV